MRRRPRPVNWLWLRRSHQKAQATGSELSLGGQEHGPKRPGAPMGRW